MSTTLTAGAMRAAEKLHPEYSLDWWMTVAHQSLQYQNLFCQACDERERIARLIDAESGLLELLTSLEACLPQVELVIKGRDFTYGKLSYEAQIDEIARKARKAIAKAKGLTP